MKLLMAVRQVNVLHNMVNRLTLDFQTRERGGGGEEAGDTEKEKERQTDRETDRRTETGVGEMKDGGWRSEEEIDTEKEKGR